MDLKSLFSGIVELCISFKVWKVFNNEKYNQNLFNTLICQQLFTSAKTQILREKSSVKYLTFSSKLPPDNFELQVWNYPGLTEFIIVSLLFLLSLFESTFISTFQVLEQTLFFCYQKKMLDLILIYLAISMDLTPTFCKLEIQISLPG